METQEKEGKLVPFTDVPEVIFSEIMRDVDLVVSVAHVGGVDPEASLLTVEMRTVIITEMLRLLKLTNVEMKGAHAFINGTLGQYTVHLGSGVGHKMASGALNILLIHLQHRGRIFLPFVDDDPKTAINAGNGPGTDDQAELLLLDKPSMGLVRCKDF